MKPRIALLKETITCMGIVLSCLGLAEAEQANWKVLGGTMKRRGLAYFAVTVLCVLSARHVGAATENFNVTLFGHSAGLSNTGSFVTFIGDSAGFSNSGDDNTFVGDSAGLSNTNGFENTFVGSSAGRANTEGNFNTFMGALTGSSNTTGTDNTFVGDETGIACIDGKENTFVGSLAGISNIDGDGNVFLGFDAGSNETGSNKLYIDNCFLVDSSFKCTLPLIYGEFDNRVVGIGTTSPAAALEVSSPGATNRGLFISQTSNDSNAAVFKIRKSRGAGAILSGDFIANYGFMGFDGTSFGDAGRIRTFAAENWTTAAHGATMIFENVPTGTTTAVEHMRITPSGNVGIGTNNPTNPLQMGSGAFVSAGGVWTNASSREYKENIRDLTTAEAMKTLEGLDPVKYNYKADKEDKHVGFIAEDVPDLVATKDRKGLSPMDIVAVLTKVVQEKSRIIEEQKKTLEEQRCINEVVMEKLSKLQVEVNRIKSGDIAAIVVAQ